MRLLVSTFTISLLLLPSTAFSDGTFFWSTNPFESGAVAQTTHPYQFDYFEYQQNSDLLDLFLYYAPGPTGISDSIDMEFEFKNGTIVSAEVLDFGLEFGEGGPVLGSRWNEINETVIQGNQVRFRASNSANGGLSPANTGTGFLTDIGFDNTSNAFIVASVRLIGFSTDINTLAATTINNEVEVKADYSTSRVEADICFLDPPHGNFNGSFDLLDGRGAIAGLAFCTTELGVFCDGTVWHRFEPAISGIFTCNTFGSSVIDTQLEIYVGETSDSLTQLVFNDDAGCGTQSRTSFPVEAGQRYSIRILSNPPEQKNTLLNYEFMEGAIFGDTNLDGAVNLLDVAPFVELLTSEEYSPVADVNFDGEVNLLDIEPFVELLVAS